MSLHSSSRSNLLPSDLLNSHPGQRRASERKKKNREARPPFDPKALKASAEERQRIVRQNSDELLAKIETNRIRSRWD